MKSQIKTLREIKEILCDLACKDELPLDMGALDIELLKPAFYNGKDRYLTIDATSGRRVYDRKLMKYLT